MAFQDFPNESLSSKEKTISEPSVLRAAGVTGVATLISRFLGLIREQVFAFMFGAGFATDAFNVAFRIPSLLRNLFAEGAMSASLIPTFTRARAEGGDEYAWRVAGLVFRVLFCVVGTIAILGMLFAPGLADLYASAYRDVPGKFELTVRMTRIMFPYFPLVALAAAFMGILNACGKFFIPAFSGAVFNIFSVVTGVTAALAIRHWGIGGMDPIEGMAIGVVAGGAAQAFCQLPVLFRSGYRSIPRRSQDLVWYRDAALRRMLWMMIPGTLGLAATQINVLVNTILATSQGTGAVSWLNYAFRLMQFPIGVFGVSLAAATLPVLSKRWVEKDIQGLESTLGQTLRHIFAINLPASAGLAFLSQPIIQMIFQYGRFKASDTEATALALVMYSLGLTAYSAVKVLVPACYAVGRTRIAVISSAVTVAVTITLNLLMVRPFGYWGLALGTSVGAVVNALLLLFALKKVLRGAGGSFSYGPLAKSFLSNGLAALVMGGCIFATVRLLDAWIPEAEFVSAMGKHAVLFFRLFRVTFLTGEGIGVLLIAAKVLGLRDLEEMIDLFVSRLKKKLSRKPS